MSAFSHCLVRIARAFAALLGGRLRRVAEDAGLGVGGVTRVAGEQPGLVAGVVLRRIPAVVGHGLLHVDELRLEHEMDRRLDLVGVTAPLLGLEGA